MKVWITKYALTDGIFAVDGEVSEVAPSMVTYRVGSGREKQHAHRGDWHISEGSAVERAEKMRVARIKSLQKSIEKLRKLSFRCAP